MGILKTILTELLADGPVSNAPPPESVHRDPRPDPFLTLDSHHRSVSHDIQALRTAVVEVTEQVRALKQQVRSATDRAEQVFSWLAKLRTAIGKATDTELALMREDFGGKSDDEIRETLAELDEGRASRA